MTPQPPRTVRYEIVVEAIGEESSTIRQLRFLLKDMRRYYRLRCVRVREVKVAKRD